MVGVDNTEWHRRRFLQIEPQKSRHSMAKCRALVWEHS